MTWRLGIDLGTNSLGWAALKLDQLENQFVPVGLLDCGVRIFSDGRNPKDNQSNAAKRREPRSARKNRDRYKRRRSRLMRELIQFGLMPADENERKALEGGKGIPLVNSDPWILRARALNVEIHPYQLGRAIFHLHQRRGFKSNRKTDRADGNESGKVYDATRRTLENLKQNNVRTIGEFFGLPRFRAAVHNMKSAKGERIAQPLARVRKSGEGAKWQYDYYPTRELIVSEFELLWEAQKQYHSEILVEEARLRLRDTIEWQHPLKSPPVGKCTLMPEEQRAAKALPSSQRMRMLQEVNSLRITPTGAPKSALDLAQRNQLIERLCVPTNKTGKVTFSQIRTLLDLSKYDKFNTESQNRKDLTGDETAAGLMQEDRWGSAWLDLSLSVQDEIVDRLINEEDEKALVSWLCDRHGLEEDQAYRVADCPLPEGYGALSTKAISKILPILEREVIVYSDAVEKALGISHSQFGTGEVFDKGLPYYGYILERSVAFGTGEPTDNDEKRYGKIANPTVHVALNQIRSVINDLIKRFGAPHQIVVELARDLPLSAVAKSKLEKKLTENKTANDLRREKLTNEYRQSDSYENRMRLRLYEDLEPLGKRCVFSGEQIGNHNLFSPEVEIEHILPFSRTFDDSYSNKTLSMRQANRDKSNRTPYEAFGHSPDNYDWEEISKRADELPASKNWRFGPDAMDRFEQSEGGFLARQLTDTQYISRLAKAYLESIYGGQGHKGADNRVTVIPGRLTADLRHVWGLNSVLRGHNEPESEAQIKNRNDHRHHAIDAIVVACTDLAMLQAAARQSKKNEQDYSGRLLAGVDQPWTGFRTQVEESVRNIVVSHKPDHGIQDAIFLDSAMSVIAEPDEEQSKNHVPLMRKYVPLESIDRKYLDPGNKKTWTVVDPDIRLKLAELVAGKSDREMKQIITDWGKSNSPAVKRLRVYKRESGHPIYHRDDRTKPYKYYKSAGNYCYDIWIGENGKWMGEIISTIEAYQFSRKNENWWKTLKGRDGRQLIMRLRKKDFLQLEHNGREIILQIAYLSNGIIALVEHFEANVDSRVRDKNEELKYIFKSPGSLGTSNAKRVTVSPSGIVKIYH